MGRKLRTNLPQIQELLKSSWPNLETFREQNDEFKIKQKQYYDRYHRVHSLPPIPDETEVWITSGKSLTPGCVSASADTP